MESKALVFDRKAKTILEKYNSISDKKVGIDPESLRLILEIIKELIGAYNKCYRPATAAVLNMQKPGAVSKRRLRQFIAAAGLPDDFDKKKLETAFLEVGKAISEEEVIGMYEVFKATSK